MKEEIVMEKIVTRESLISLINGDRERAKIAVGRALVHLLDRQTQDEKVSLVTRNNNARGFTPADAHSGSLTAKYFVKTGTIHD